MNATVLLPAARPVPIPRRSWRGRAGVAIAREGILFRLSAGLPTKKKQLTWFSDFGFSFAMTSMVGSTFVAVSIIMAALTPAKVSDVKSNTSATAAAKPPRMIYVNSF
jgi:hypothetical protein